MIQFLENTVAAVQMLGSTPLNAFVTLLGGDDEYLVDANDNLVSFISVYGAMKHVGEAEREAIVDGFERSFSTLLKEPGHTIEVCWRGDPSASPLIVDEFVADLGEGAVKAGLEVPELLDGKRSILKDRVLFEHCIIAFWTKAKVLNTAERRSDALERNRRIGAQKVLHGLRPITGLRKLQIKHRAAADAFVEQCEKQGILARRISTKQGLCQAREMLYPNLTGSGWQPVYPGEGGWDTVEERADPDDASGHFPPRLAEQMTPIGAADINNYIVEIGGYIFSYLNMVYGSSHHADFSELVKIVNRTGNSIPWRILWRIEGGVKDRELDRVLASVLEKTNAINGLILENLKAAEEYHKKGIARVYFSASICTWAPADRRDQLDAQISQLQRAVGNWAGIQVAADTKDPLQGVYSSVPAMAEKTVLRKAKPRAADAFRFLPIMRPGSPWSRGSIMFHTPDGRPFYYEMGSSKQTAWFDIIIGQQGSGKSALVNGLNLAAALDFAREGSANELPQIGIIDIGYSSRGLIECIRDGLPENRKHEAKYIRWQNDNAHAVNVFDTPLGLREPLPVQLDFLKNFVCAVLGVFGSNGEDILRDIVSSVVEEAYRQTGDRVSQKTYEPGLVENVDKLLANIGKELPAKASWYEVVDVLFEEGFHYEALLAQRYAVPTLGELAEAAHSDRVRDGYENALIGQERAIDTFTRKLDRAVTNYKVLSKETQFEIRDTSVVSLDLSEVTAGSGELRKQRIEVMYLAARQLIGGEYYLVEEDFSTVDERYRRFHQERIRKLGRKKKRLVYDEFHLTEGAQAVQQQLENDVRVGRKYDVQVALVSQLITDFSDDLLSLARSFFVCSSGGDKGLEAIRATLNLAEAAATIIRTRLNGPSRTEGAPFYGIFNTSDGRFEHLLVHSMSSQELWAMTTKRKDVEFKRELERKVGRRRAWSLLCHHFPGGSAQERLETVTARLAARNATEDPVDALIREILEFGHEV